MPATIDVLRNGEEIVASAPLNMTFLPVVEVSAKKCNTDSYVMGRLRVTDPNEDGYDAVMNAGFRYRGASSTMYPKKSFAVKLYDAEGNSLDHEFFGLRNDNNWILDAMYNDDVCMRNRVSTDLWNDIATQPYHRRKGWEKKAKTGTRGRFVEVICNGRYHGLYCMTEKIDRKQLKLKKFVAAKRDENGAYLSLDTIHSTLYKAVNWTYEVFMGHDFDANTYPQKAPSAYYNNLKREGWAGYEIKYPDWEKERIDWGPLWNAVNFVATANDEAFDEEVDAFFDYPVLRDYYLFAEIILAKDNRGKNMYYFNYDQRGSECSKMLGLTPWDLDATWGSTWDSKKDETTTPDNDYAEYMLHHTLFYRLNRSIRWNWTRDLKVRYAEWRNEGVSAESLIGRFLDYGDLLSQSGADKREAQRWGAQHKSIADSLGYVKEWIEKRIQHLDQQYDYSPIINGIQQPLTNDSFVDATGGRGCITLHATKPTMVRIHNMSGRLVQTVNLSRSLMQVDGLAPGIYLVGGKKVAVW